MTFLKDLFSRGIGEMSELTRSGEHGSRKVNR
jgi:hypothetical protein